MYKNFIMDMNLEFNRRLMLVEKQLNLPCDDTLISIKIEPNIKISGENMPLEFSVSS